MNEFKIGERVRLLTGKAKHDLNAGDVGVVACLKNEHDHLIGVKWSNINTGHDCNGTVTDDSGWYVHKDYLELDCFSLENE